ncbi:MAG: channel protein TolC [Hyphomicrobium sp. 32-62-53]|nr:MAG: channel protein TolC [Hyphomicrobium sp. 12-62-95]OYX99936.1 MAG: channel protein TolC [Hyphomicrobium sp. 32-62-53]
MMAVCAPAPAQALTLDEALASAYEYSPRIDAERARLRATDEEVPIAKSGYRPDIGVSADVGYRATDTSPGPTSERKPRGYGVSITQPIFRGFQVTNAVSQAESIVRAGRETLRTVEQEILLEAVTAFMDVVRDQAIIRLNENNLKVLSEELKATQDRFAVGEVTRTDVAQSEARRADAVAQLDQARANLQTSRAAFERTVGLPATGLVEPSLKMSMLPASQDEAVGIGTQENPNIVGALYNEQAARYNVDRIRGALLPQIQVEGDYTDRFGESQGIRETETAQVVGRVTVPIYQQGGIVHAQVRQAKHEHLARLQDIEQARVVVKANVIAAWSQLLGARAQLESAKAAVDANQTALTGVREEERVGQRTLIEVLNAQQELLNSQVNLVTTRRNVIVAAYGLQAALGRLDALSLGVTGTVYDPAAHYEEVDRKWFGISITHEDGRREHMDVDTSVMK